MDDLSLEATLGNVKDAKGLYDTYAKIQSLLNRKAASLQTLKSMAENNPNGRVSSNDPTNAQLYENEQKKYDDLLANQTTLQQAIDKSNESGFASAKNYLQSVVLGNQPNTGGTANTVNTADITNTEDLASLMSGGKPVSTPVKSTEADVINPEDLKPTGTYKTTPSTANNTTPATAKTETVSKNPDVSDIQKNTKFNAVNSNSPDYGKFDMRSIYGNNWIGPREGSLLDSLYLGPHIARANQNASNIYRTGQALQIDKAKEDPVVFDFANKLMQQGFGADEALTIAMYQRLGQKGSPGAASTYATASQQGINSMTDRSVLGGLATGTPFQGANVAGLNATSPITAVTMNPDGTYNVGLANGNIAVRASAANIIPLLGQLGQAGVGGSGSKLGNLFKGIGGTAAQNKGLAYSLNQGKDEKDTSGSINKTEKELMELYRKAVDPNKKDGDKPEDPAKIS